MRKFKNLTNDEDTDIASIFILTRMKSSYLLKNSHKKIEPFIEPIDSPITYAIHLVNIMKDVYPAGRNKV